MLSVRASAHYVVSTLDKSNILLGAMVMASVQLSLLRRRTISKKASKLIEGPAYTGVMSGIPTHVERNRRVTIGEATLRGDNKKADSASCF